MSLQGQYTPGALLKDNWLKAPKTDTARKSFEDYPDEDPGFSLDGAGDWPGADGPASESLDGVPSESLDEFPPDGEPKIDRSTGPKAVPAKEKVVVPSVRGGKKER